MYGQGAGLKFAENRFAGQDASLRPAVLAPETARACRILVVDDDPTILHLTAEMLAHLGHRVETAENGMTALGKSRACQFDFVLTDLEMPLMNGHQLAERLKKTSPGTITFIMTGRSRAEVLDLMATDAVQGWLFKPFDLIEFSAMINEMMLSTA